MSAPYGFAREGDTITLTLTSDDFIALLMCLGTSAAYPQTHRISLIMANRINEGRPLSEWRPYEIPGPEA